MLDALDCRYFVKHLLTLLLPTQSIFLSFIDVVLESQLQKETGDIFYLSKMLNIYILLSSLFVAFVTVLESAKSLNLM